MREVILDTSFILSCIRSKIDFLEEISFMGFLSVIPSRVIDEIKKLSFKKAEAKIALEIITKNHIKKINIFGSTVDNGIINYGKKNSETVIATLDSGIKKKAKNPKLIIRGKKKLELV